jgi:ATP-dependent DNA helicase RecQ
MKDQLDFLLSHKIPAARLDSSLERDEYNKVLSQAQSNQIKILMISVERFKNERFRTHLKRMNISLMVIDEAHCLSEWGHNFRPDYLKLPLYKKEFNIPQVLLLTATATTKVVTDMQNKFALDDKDVVITGFYRGNLFLHMKPTPPSQRNSALLNTLVKDASLPTIVYVTLQKTATNIAQFLQENGINAQHYHAGLKSEERETIQNNFMAGSVNCVVATIAFGMGIDKEDVRRVIHYDLPKSIENYSQEIGRAGRDNQKSICQILANDEAITVHENFVYGDTPELESIAELLQQIQSSQESFWETKIISLSNALNIRVLPLKTLLVYLEMEGIIQPKYTYYEEYSFKNTDATPIVNQFNGERKVFIAAIFNHCVSKKLWSYVDIQAILNNYPTDRSRIITALEYLEQKGQLQLQAKQSVERFEVTNKNFNLDELSQKMHALFQSKEKVEINRIHVMLDFFQADCCLSVRLADYFGEKLSFEKCNHCSHCLTGAADFCSATQLKPLDEYDFQTLCGDFIQQIEGSYNHNNLNKFLCGIYTPIFKKYKIRNLSQFGRLEKHPFKLVGQWIRSQV